MDFLVTAGASSTERQAGVIFTSPVTVAEGTTPQIYLTMDMIHSTQILVTGTGTTLGPLTAGTNDPVALFGGLTKGTSLYYSDKTSINSYVVSGAKTHRIFYDADNKPLYLIGSTFCAPDSGPKGAWASPPIGATVGGYLGKDSSNMLAWALPTTSDYIAYAGYFKMQEQLTVGERQA